MKLKEILKLAISPDWWLIEKAIDKMEESKRIKYDCNYSIR